MEEKLIIAGSGGQGIMLAGKVLATSAMREGRFVTWFPSYGAEVRGGTAHCMVIVSSSPVGSPYIDTADTLIAMNNLSVERFASRVRPGGLVLANSSFSPDDPGSRGIRRYPFTDTAVVLGDMRVANMAALGCYLALKPTCRLETVMAVIDAMAPVDKKHLVEVNRRALAEGMKLAGPRRSPRRVRKDIYG